MKVELLTTYEHFKHMELIATEAAFTCPTLTWHSNSDKLKEKEPKEVLKNIIKNGYESILKHITLNYYVQDISRALLQELARHRNIFLSVESTRHTLKKKLEDIDWLCNFMNKLSPLEYKIFANCLRVIASVFYELPNDELKKGLPEFFPTRLILTLNIRALRHIFEERTKLVAFMEFRKLGVELFNRVPTEFKYLLEDCVYVG